MEKYLKRMILLFIGIMFIYTTKADEGEQLFKTTCAACHTIGKGRLVGPDLLGVNNKRSLEWLISFIKSSTTVIKTGDPDAIAIYDAYNKLLMPDNNYSDTQIVNILNYIQSGGSDAARVNNEAAVDILSEVTTENVSDGLKLFSGASRFENGGSACTSCHKVQDERIFSSGTLAKDLSKSFDIMGSAGIAAVIKNPPFPVMQAAYNNAILKEEEVINLAAYLRSVSKERIYQRPSEFSILFALLGIFVFIGVFMMTIILYFKRKKLAVNHRILNRPSKVIN